MFRQSSDSEDYGDYRILILKALKTEFQVVLFKHQTLHTFKHFINNGLQTKIFLNLKENF